VKAATGIFHDESATEWQPGDSVPDWLIEVAPWLLDDGHVVADDAELPDGGSKATNTESVVDDKADAADDADDETGAL